MRRRFREGIAGRCHSRGCAATAPPSGAEGPARNRRESGNTGINLGLSSSRPPRAGCNSAQPAPGTDPLWSHCDAKPMRRSIMARTATAASLRPQAAGRLRRRAAGSDPAEAQPRRAAHRRRPGRGSAIALSTSSRQRRRGQAGIEYKRPVARTTHPPRAIKQVRAYRQHAACGWISSSSAAARASRGVT